MCACDPRARTPFCGKPGCQWPPSSAQIGVVGETTASSEDRTGLTDAEHRFMELTAELMSLFVREIVANDGWPSRVMDINEMAARIHAIQYPVLAQAAARMHPSMYRLLGAEVES